MTITVLPPGREAAEPPEARGIPRDHVRLLVADRETLTHSRFHELPRFLHPGDLLVVNTSATLSAAVPADGVVVHFATWLDSGEWVVEIRSADAHPVDWTTLRPGMRYTAAGVGIELEAPWLPDGRRLWRASVDTADVPRWLQRHGRPITYAYVDRQWPARYYRTVFGKDLGSAEMPSAGRPFTRRLVTDLVTAGIAVAPITLHTGVSSPEIGEPPAPERFTVPDWTARLVNNVRATGGRVVAVGTTVTRALETTADESGRVLPAAGWTDLVLSTDRPARVVDGLITGWHEPGASHLMLLEAVAGGATVERAYDAALAGEYLWHEFGDSALLFR